MQKSYRDPAKQLSRERLRRFIRKELCGFKKPKTLSVLCFPGAEREGEEAIEVREIYDPLGIPRCNIVGLELDRERAERLRAANLGIRVENCSDSRFFEECKGGFDIISLDYTGYRSHNVAKTIQLIARRQLLEALSVLAVNNMAKRENRNAQDYLHRMAAWTRFFSEDHPDSELNRGRARRFVEKIGGSFDERDDEAVLAESRDMFTKDIMALLYCGGLSGEMVVGEQNDFILSYPGARKLQKSMHGDCVSMGKDPREHYNFEFQIHLEEMTRHVARLLGLGGAKHAEYVCGEILLRAYSGSYLTKGLERCSYVSNSGTPMEMDMFLLGNVARYMRRVDSAFAFREEDGNRILDTISGFDRRGLLKQMKKMTIEIGEYHGRFFYPDLPPRVRLKSDDINAC
jgi:hypothetical protein